MSELAKKGDPAFPVPPGGWRGMTLRDYFAAAALLAVGTGMSDENVAKYCYRLADAMLKERSK